jgi:transcriptional regulator GlxA family with amidase domain
MDIAIPLFDRFTALDAIGPYEVLSRLPGARVRWVGLEARTYESDRGLRIAVDTTLEEVPAPEVLVVPGGMGTRTLVDDPRMLDWVRGVHATSTWTTSVCTGSLVLAAAGLLDGVRATTHWAALDLLGELGAVPVADERVVEVGKIVTAAGVSSGIDMALRLAAKIARPEVAQAIQLVIEYDPQPPFDTGSTAKAPREIVELVRSAALD